MADWTRALLRRSAVLALLALSVCRQGDIVLDAGEPVVSAGRYASTAATLAETGKRAPARTILVLTSGGADGAFGAGVLQAGAGSRHANVRGTAFFVVV